MKLTYLILSAIILYSCNKTVELKTTNVLAVSSLKDSVVFTDTIVGSGNGEYNANLHQYTNFDSMFLKASVTQHGNNHRIDTYEFNGLEEFSETRLSDYNNTLVWRTKIYSPQWYLFTGEDYVYGVYVEYSDSYVKDSVFLSVVYYIQNKN